MAEESGLSFQEVGSGTPVLFIHGWEMDGASEAYDFEPIFSSSTGFSRIYIDLPAMGSSPSYQVQDLSDIYAHLDRFIAQRFGTTTKFLLVGSSLGAYLARVLAAKLHQQVVGLLLRVPLVQPDDKLRDVDPFQPLVRSVDVPEKASPSAAEEPSDPVLIQTPTYIKALREKFSNVYLPAIHQANNTVLDPIRKDPLRYQLGPAFVESLKQKFFAPTLIVTGRHDPVVGYRDSLPLTEVYPRSTFVVLDRGTHDLPLDQGDLFGALVRDWLCRANEWRSSRQ